jgi:CCR4-NOT transcription complex subunit 6
MAFRCLNWNILHSLESTRISKFSYCNPQSLATIPRMSKVTELLNKTRPDIVFFQELDADLMRNIEPALELLSRAHVSFNESLPSKDGLGIYFNSKRFSILSSDTFRFCNVLDKHLPALQEFIRHDHSPLSLSRALHRELREKLNMAILVKMRDKVTNRVFMVCSSHLFWDPSYPDIKLIQSYILGKEIAEKSTGLPVVIGADLNSIPYSSGVYELLIGKGYVDLSHPHHPVSLRSSRLNNRLEPVTAQGVPALSLPRQFRSAMKEAFGKEPLYTNYTKGFKGCLDYILISDEIKTVGAEPLPNESTLSAEVALPNSIFPSDHLPLTVDLELS